ncbi:MAG: carboxysome peptide A [Cyanobium sp.]
MLICRVVKPLVSTNRIPDFEHKHLQVVLDGSTQKVAVDAVGSKPGDWVICVGSSAAREAAGSKSYPSDLTIVGIIDYWDPDAAKAAAAALSPPKPADPVPSPPAPAGSLSTASAPTDPAPSQGTGITDGRGESNGAEGLGG